MHFSKEGKMKNLDDHRTRGKSEMSVLFESYEMMKDFFIKENLFLGEREGFSEKLLNIIVLCIFEKD